MKRFAVCLLMSGLLLASVASQASAVSYGLGFRNFAPGDLEFVRQSGADVYRVELDFSCTGGGNWAEFDSLVEGSWKRRITILPTLVRSAPECGAAAHKQYLNSGDGNWSAWWWWARSAVERYGVNGSFWVGKAHPTPITAWEVGNEPNLAMNNPGGAAVQPKAYGEFLKHTSDAIQAGSVTKTGVGTNVLVGGLALHAGTFAGTFLQEMGNTSSYTGVAIHPYSLANGLPGVQQEVNDVRYALDNFVSSGKSKSLWITEIGWAVPPATEGFPPGGHAVSEEEQAALLNSSFDWLESAAASHQIKLITWYKIQDQTEGGLHWDEHTGLRRFDGSFRPAWFAFRAQAGALAEPSWHDYNLGGPFASDPDVASWSWNRLDLFARAPGGVLWTRYYDSGVWSSWINLGGSIEGAPSAVSWSPGRIDVVARLPQVPPSGSSLEHRWYDGSWHSEVFGGELTSDPDVSSWGPGRLDVFARGPKGELLTKYFNGAWSGWVNLGGSIVGGPAAVSWGPQRIDVVARAPVVAPATTSTLEHWWWDGAWHNENLGGELTSDPDIASWDTGRLDVFARGPSGELWTRNLGDGKWSGWINLGGTITGGPGAVSWAPGRIDVFARKASDNSIDQWWYAP